MFSIRSFAAFCIVGLWIGPAHAATFVVTNNFDAGGGSLRQAIADAGARDTISFALPPRSVITLTTGQLLIDKSLIIQGPGANLLTVKRSAASGTPSFGIFAIPGAFLVDISGLTISNGKAPLGAGIYNGEGQVVITDCVITGNSADDSGGGVYNETGVASVRYMIIRNSLISGNFAITGGQARGGGIYNDGRLHLIDSTVSGNVAAYGGGFASRLFGTKISGSTITANVATGFGGGIFADPGGNFTPNVGDSIVAGNSNPPNESCSDVSGNFASNGFNLIGKSNCSTGFGVNTDRVGSGVTPINPMLGPLQDNGGPTFTHALLAGSPAIRNGFANGRTADQRGFPRLLRSLNGAGGDNSSIGAFEFGSGSLDIDANGSVDALTDGLMIVRYLFGMTGDALVSRAIGKFAQRINSTDILAYLNGIRVALDADGNNRADAQTDGLLILRYLFGLRGAPLTAGAIAADASRLTAPPIESYINFLQNP